MKVVIVRANGTQEHVECLNPPFLIEGALIEKIELNKEVSMYHDEMAEQRDAKENPWAGAIVKEFSGWVIPIFGDVVLTGYEAYLA